MTFVDLGLWNTFDENLHQFHLIEPEKNGLKTSLDVFVPPVILVMVKMALK